MNTNGSIYNAIMKAADSVEIESNWNWFSTAIPDCGTTGCAVGWIGHHLGIKGGIWKVSQALGFSPDDGCSSLYHAIDGAGGSRLCTQIGKEVAPVLRKFAQRFKPAITGIPDSIRAIFVPGMRVS